MGRYPAEAVAMLVRIAHRTERILPLREEEEEPGSTRHKGEISEAISHATRSVAMDISAKAIITCTITGSTARQASKYRPPVPIVGISPRLGTVRRLMLSWGVMPLLSPDYEDTDDMIEKALERTLQSGIVHKGDAVVITAGIRSGVPGTTNLLKAILIP